MGDGYFDKEALDAIIEAALEVGLADRPRALLLAGVPRAVRDALPVVERPGDQLRLDVVHLNEHPLVAGRALVHLWIDNAARLAQGHPGAAALARLGGLGPPVIALSAEDQGERGARAVFVGSASPDLAGYRQAAIETCRRSGLTPITTEDGETADALEASLRRLDGCSLYVGVFAHRYGHVPAGADRSIVEAEYRRAGALGLERRCFIVDPEQPWSPEHYEQRHPERLRAFLADVRAEVDWAPFSTIDSLRARLLTALTHWTRLDLPDPRPTTAALPLQPGLLVGREAELRRVMACVFAGGCTVLRGWPGVGKTTLAAAVAQAAVSSSQVGAVHWVQLGREGSPLRALLSLATGLGARPGEGGATLEALMAWVRRRLPPRSLLSVDDAWHADAATPFLHLGAHSVVITTRSPAVARRLAVPSRVVVVDVLSEPAARDLLAVLTPLATRAAPRAIQRLLRGLETLPLALRVAGRLLEAEGALGVPLEPLVDELVAGERLLAEPAPADRFEAELGAAPTLDALFGRSTAALPPIARRRFAMLGLFAEKPASFDAAALEALWEVDEALTTVRLLVDRGLLEPRPEIARFQTHALLAAHARALLGR